MSQDPEDSALEAKPKHPRDIADLAALIVSNLTSDTPVEDVTVTIYVWRDCAMTIKFPSGRRTYLSPGHGHTLDSTVHEIAMNAIRFYCEESGIAVAQIRVHMVPPELSKGEQILAWLQALPGISITPLLPDEIGFGGPLPPAGEAG